MAVVKLNSKKSFYFPVLITIISVDQFSIVYRITFQRDSFYPDITFTVPYQSLLYFTTWS